MANSRRSKRSTGWAIATATDDPRARAGRDRDESPSSAEPRELPSRRARRRRPRLSPLTRRILAVNVAALALLGLGLLYLGGYRTSLINAQLDALQTQGEISAAALAEGAVFETPGEPEYLIPELSRQMLKRLVEPTKTRARLFDAAGTLVADSRWLPGPGDTVQVVALDPPDGDGSPARLSERIINSLRRLLPASTDYPPYVEYVAPTAQDYTEVAAALEGENARAVRRDRETGDLVLSVAVPIQRYKKVLGAVLFSTGSRDIEQAINQVRLEILKVFLIVLSLTVLLSIYLAGTIARPIRRLAIAAERVRRGHGRQVAIPDLTERGDEIGELSGALREMTDALWRRMDAIEHFAADVAHEIKNPLTSLKSAVETVARVTDPEKQRRLLAVVVEDVARLDRLISDISDASRLDAEMSRLELEPVPLTDMLQALVAVHEAAQREGAPRLELALPPGPARSALTVLGMESRLGQVFRNLIANAISFSPPGGTIRIAAERHGDVVSVTVEDEGPGIPEGKLEAIFDRFYTERPAAEKFGTHSGLGLSISKQIVEAHHGTIRAENRRDNQGRIVGARFVVRLPAA
jgi:two-component system, OmpR family, sensor histidine kinase ChvG